MRRRRRPAAAGLTVPLLLPLLLRLLLGPAVAAAPARRSPLDLSCRRLLQEFKDVMASGMALGVSSASATSGEHVRLGPVRGNLHEWHFTIAGPPGSVYEGGLYHGRVLLPADYPASAPRLQMLNPSGRFETGKDICLSATSFHPEAWSPSWTVRTIVSALRSHMATKAVEVGGIEASAARRLVLAYRSRAFRCRQCGTDHARLAEEGWKDLPKVALPPSLVKGQAERRAAAEAAPAGAKGAVGWRGRGPGSALIGFGLSVYRQYRIPLMLCLLFTAFYVMLNAPPPLPPPAAVAGTSALLL